MALAPFFERIYGALGGHLSVSRESLTAALEDVAVGIQARPRSRTSDKWIAELSTNLLARLYPRLAISGSQEHCAQLQHLASRINPNIEFVKEAPPSNSICIGSSGGAEGALIPNATGWVARLDHLSPRRAGPANPYAAAAAAALACSELFRRIFLKSDPEPDLAMSLLNFDEETGADLEPMPANLGDVLFVGVGAVGNAALWVLARDANIKGRLWLVDPEELTLLNLQRYVLANYEDVSQSKVLLGQRALSATKLSTELAQTSLEEFARAHRGIDIPTISISVDNVDARRSAQGLLPRLIVNGWTGDKALGASWHVFSRNAACLACLYQPHGQGLSATEQAARALGLPPDRAALLWVTRQPLSDEDIARAATSLGVDVSVLSPWLGKQLGDLYTDVVCGAVPLDVAGIGRVETVPLAHQSVLAGVLMASELVKRTNPQLGSLSQAEPLVSWDDVLRPPPAIWRKPRAREPGCICGDQDYQETYRRKWETTLQKRSPV